MGYRATFDEERKFGIELEGYGLSRLEICEHLEQEKILTSIGDTYSKSKGKWTVGTDGTIQHSYPIEIISPILSGSNSFNQIEKVCKILNRIGLQTDSRCGFHIHWSVPDYTGRDTINLLRLYAKYEKVLDLFFDPSRRENKNQNCRSLIKQEGISWIYSLNKPFYYQAHQIAQEFEKTQTLEHTTSLPSARHHKVNLCSINKYGTVEFRQHQGTFDFEEIKNWIIFSQQLVNRARDSMVSDGMVAWTTLIRTFALSDTQLEYHLPEENKFLSSTREYYRKIYRENLEGEKQYVA